MKQTLTAKLKLEVTEEQFAALRKTQLAYREALNFASEYAFASKIFDRIQLQKECYREIKKRFGLPSQMACNVTRQVGATYKGLWKKVRRNSEHRRRGWTRRRYRGLDVPPKFSSPTLTYSYGRDFSFRSERFLSVRTLSGRIIVPYHSYERHAKLIRKGISGGVKVGGRDG